MAFEINSFNNVTSGAARGLRVWSYTNTGDTLAEIISDDYFLPITNALSANDLIDVQGSNGRGQFYVATANSTTVTLGTSEGVAKIVVTLSSLDILGLRALQVELVPAPDFDSMIVFEDAVLQLAYQTTPYTESDDNMAIRYGNDTGIIVSTSIEATNFIDETVSMATRAIPIANAIATAEQARGQSLVIHNTGDSEYANGDSSVEVEICFRIVEIA